MVFCKLKLNFFSICKLVICGDKGRYLGGGGTYTQQCNKKSCGKDRGMAQRGNRNATNLLKKTKNKPTQKTLKLELMQDNQ